MNNTETVNLIGNITEKYLDKGLFIVDIAAKLSGNSSKITIIIDGDDGVGIDQYAKINRKVGAEIEDQQLIDHAYRLEVTSPGVDMPLKLTRQYIKNVGRDVRINLNDGTEISGKLEEVSDLEVKVRPFRKTKNKSKKSYQEETQSIAFTNIHKTNILVSFK